MANPGGLNLNISPYFDDYDEEKKFARVLFVPGRAVQARELTQMQTYQQKQIQRFAEYFFRQGSIVDGCEPSLDLRMEYVKLQTGFEGVEVNTNNFLNKRIVGANTGVEAYVGLATNVSGSDPKTLFINYKSAGALRLTVTSFGSTAITVGNTLNFLNTTDGNSANAIITAFVQDPITDEYYVYCNSLFGSPNTAAGSIGASTVDGSGANVTITITDFLDKRSSTVFEESELLFTLARTPALLANASYANTSTVRATTFVEDEGTADEVTYRFGSKYTLGDGVVYISDHFVKHNSQTIILDKYKNTPSYKIGLVPQKDFIDTVDDQSLLDNAQGTPNFQALGADRLFINTILTKIPLNQSTDETEFVGVAEVENGLIKKRPQNDVDSNLEKAIANRTFEESGNYTVSDPKVFVREHLNQAGNGGKFAAAEGGNNELLVIETDPFISYVKGYRNTLLTKAFTPLRKGTDTQYIEQTKTTIVVGSYIPVKEMVGSWDYMESSKIDLYDTAQQAISNGSFSSTTVQGTKIGEARVRVVEYASGTPGHADAVYNLYLFDIEMVPGKFFQDVRSVYDSIAGLPDRYADVIVDTAGNASLRESAFEPSIFKLPYGGIKTIRDDQNDIESEFQFRKEFQVFFNQSGIITLVTTDLNETFASGDTTSLSNINYLVIPTITANTASLSGTANVVSGNDYVFGTGTDFEDRFLAGDVIRVGTEDRVIEEIISDTVLVVENNWSGNANTENYSKVIPAGVPVRLFGIGTLGPAEERAVTVGAIPQTVEIDLKEDTLVSSAGAGFTARVTATMNRANAREMRKVLANNVTTIINANTHPNELVGPFYLGYGDVYQIRSIWQSDSFDNPPVAGAASNTNVTSSYTLDNGQRDTAYEHGAIIPKVGVVPTGRLLVSFDHFTHDTSQGIGYLSVDSYPINDTATSNTTIRTEQIPIYRSTRTGTEYSLRDCIDFRPIRTANTTATNPLPTVSTIVTGTANVVSGNSTVIGTTTTFLSSLANNDIIRIANQERRISTIVSDTELTTDAAFTVTANNEGVFRVTSGTFRIPGGGLHFPVPASDYTADLIFYKGRKAKLYVDEQGNLGVNDGSPGYPFSFPPPTIPDTLEIAELSIPVYPSLAKDIRIEPYKNRRFTMQDIGKLKTRVEQLEYYAKLNEIERQASQKLILDNDGVDKFKNGVLVDTFDGHNIGDVRNPDYKVAIDRTYRYASAYANNQVQIALKYNPDAIGTTNIRKTPGNKLMLDYTEETYVDQPFASQTINLAQELTFTWNGNLTLVPATDNWLDVSSPAEANSTLDLTGFTDNVRELVDWLNTEISPVTRFWVGEEPVTTITDVGNRFNSSARAAGGGRQVQQAQRTLVTEDQELFESRGQIDVALADINTVTERVADVSVKSVIRPRDFVFGSTGMKDGARLYAFFDDVDVTANCTQIRLVGNTTIDDLDDLYDNNGILQSDDTKYIRLDTGDLRVTGKKIYGVFRVPEGRFYVGQRSFRLTDDSLNRVSQATTIATTSIFAQGLSVVKGVDVVNTRPFTFAGFANQRVEGAAGERTVVISDTTANIQVGVWDPLSQSFYVDENSHPQGIYLTSLDLYFSSKSEDLDEGVTVEIREMQNGFPTRRVVGNEVARRENSEILTSENGTVATTFTFRNPIYLPPATEFCFVAKPDGNSVGFNVFVAELGQFDITNTEVSLRIEKQAAAGVLFTSSNDLTWSARQNQDVKFKLRLAKFATSGTAFFQNMAYSANSNFNYNAFTINMEQLKLPRTEIALDCRIANEEYDIVNFKPIRNLERIVETGVRTIANTTNEGIELPEDKSFTVRATLTSETTEVSPYIDLERMNVALERTIINNATNFQLSGTSAWSANNVVVTGSGTAFLDELSVGEFVLFGEEYRQVAKISNAEYLEVRNRFNTSSNGSILYSKNEENPTGPYASSSRYISRAVELNDGFESSDLVVYLAVNKQQGTSIKVYYKVLAEADTDSFDSKFWEEMTIDSTSTTNQNSITYNEEKYIVPTTKKTGGSQLLRGTVATTSGSVDVVGTGTVFIEDLTIGSQIAIGTGRILRTITGISNNTFLTVDSNYSTTSSGEEVYKILNNEIGYTTPDGRSFSGFKYYAIKVVFLSTNAAYAPKIKNLRAIALA